jgi:putative oxidoreductase
MKYALWIVQVLLGLVFIASGTMKAITPYDTLITNPNMSWAVLFPAWIIITIGVLEVLGGLGLILPSVTRIAPFLTGWAGVGLALTMVGAIITHIVDASYQGIIANVILGGLAAFVAWGRLSARPIPSRGTKEDAQTPATV